MLALLFPKFGAWPLAWVALVPLILAARAARPRAAAAYGLLAGVIFCSILLEWIRLFDVTGWVLLTVWQAGYVAIFALLLRVVAPESAGWRGVLAPAALWTAIEWLRSLGRGGFTWGDLAYSQHGQLPLIQLASVTGPYGLTFLIVLVNAAVAGLVTALLQRKEEFSRQRVRAAARRLVLAAGLSGIVWGWGSWRLAQPLPQGKAVRVALLQGNVSGEGRDEAFNLAKIQESVRVYLALTEKAVRARPDIIIWPETAVPDYLLYNPAIRDAIAATAARLRVNLVVGSSHRDPEGHLLNSAFLFTREGRLTGRYDKVHLVPYGEFTPWREQLDFLYRHFPVRDMDYSSGRGFFPLQTDAAPLGVAICFESAFPGIARALRNSGAQVLAIITNDAWFYYRSATWQHYDMAAFRAIENGSYVLRTATTGFSAVLDPYGRAVARTPLFTRRILVGEIQCAAALTPYMRLGDLIAWVSALAVGWMLFVRRRRP